jgi:hypothetical protein
VLESSSKPTIPSGRLSFNEREDDR